MSELSIKAEGLGKQYIIGGAEEQYDSFRDMISNAMMSPFRKFKRLSGDVAEESQFWALQNIDFEINQGDVVGVIGNNGAGKSTLLKVLSRITAPTTGRVEVHGRVASLLEVGTGFHPELTGRENIYLNGSILGMRRAQIDRKFAEIVEFADIEKFLDTPVKRYSSGMYVRLAFSVAAHLETDVLIVDEVLAVGDTKFQQKCLGKLDQAGKQGRTVIFVSHNMNLIKSLCSHAIYLKNGTVENYDLTDVVIGEYLQESSSNQNVWYSSHEDQQLKKVSLVNPSFPDRLTFSFQDELNARIEFAPKYNDDNYVLAIRISDSLGRDIFTSLDTDTSTRQTEINGRYVASCALPVQLLLPGRYQMKALLQKKQLQALSVDEEAILEFEISDVDCVINAGRVGIVSAILEWGCQPMSN